MSVSNKAAGGGCWGASLCLPPLPPPSPCQSHRVCCHDVPSGEASRLSVLPAHRAAFVSLYNLHNVHQRPPLLISYHAADKVDAALPGCRSVPLGDLGVSMLLFVTHLLTPSLTVNCAGSCVTDSVSLPEPCCDGPSNSAHMWLLPTHWRRLRPKSCDAAKVPASIDRQRGSLSACSCHRAPLRRRTYNVELPGHFL